MRASFEHIKELVEECAKLPGDFAEVGVWKGDTFAPLCRWAHLVGKKAYAIDSFEGMGEPTESDYQGGNCHYPAGALSVGGGPGVSAVMRKCGVSASSAIILRGWIPTVFNAIADGITFAFAHVDVDHFRPTQQSLDFFWPRMVKGGVLCCHDWTPKRGCLASKAFDDFLWENKLKAEGPTQSAHGWVRK